MAELKITYADLNEEAQRSIRMQIAKDLEYDARIDFEAEWMSKNPEGQDIDEDCGDYVDEKMDKWFETIDQKIDDYIEKNDMGTDYYI